MYEIGTKIRELRKGLRMTQDTLSERSGICSAQISLIEMNITNPKLSTILAIAEGLEVFPGDLFKWV